VSTDPKVQELLPPLTDAEDGQASRRSVDRDAIVSRMVEVSLTPEGRFAARARIGAALALAAGFALAAWGGAGWWKRGAAIGTGIQVVALRGNVMAIPGAKARALSVGEATTLSAEGTLETSQSAEARIKTSGGSESRPLEVSKPVGEAAPQPSSIPGPRRDPVKRRPETLAAETKLLRSGLSSEQKGDLQGAVIAFQTLITRYPESQLASDARAAALSRVKARLESSK
jgi:hypothetical protein